MYIRYKVYNKTKNCLCYFLDITNIEIYKDIPIKIETGHNLVRRFRDNDLSDCINNMILQLFYKKHKNIKTIET
jgi:hypothetical protein